MPDSENLNQTGKHAKFFPATVIGMILLQVENFVLFSAVDLVGTVT
jgi:hypothetical protein